MADHSTPQEEPLYTPAEAAALFRVRPKTVARWARQGKIPSIRTPGGHHRYRETDVHAYLNGNAPATCQIIGTDSGPVRVQGNIQTKGAEAAIRALIDAARLRMANPVDHGGGSGHTDPKTQ